MSLRKTWIRMVARAVLLLLLGVPHAGCEYAATTALTGVSMGVAYVYMNIAERTVCCELDRMGKAASLALKKMGISICNQSKDGGQRKIRAETKDLHITIKFKEITPKSTKIKVSARHLIMKDKATALEIIRQTVEEAESLAQEEGITAASAT
jgi:hypothetical protein